MADNLQVSTTAVGSDIIKPALPDVKQNVAYTDRRDEKSLLAGDGASVAVRNGQVTIAANDNAQIKCTPSGVVETTGFQHNIRANRVNMTMDEMNINNHIFNNRLYELTDFKQVTTNVLTNGVVGNFCVLGTVLVKGWEPDLNRYVFIRRLTRMPMFSPAVSPPAMMEGLGLTDNTSVTVDINGVMNTGSTTTSTNSTTSTSTTTTGTNVSTTTNSGSTDAASTTSSTTTSTGTAT